ncbi:MAG: hypothetical protein A2521_07615 [Deltaproteobacteria bacterium RIFOXYD12_FULL_57_12]|nr:MAG: hypothetical protein A2521_07615 [Deltaproteobacteria bacterium RIFOXYD12_FULL_57_12]
MNCNRLKTLIKNWYVQVQSETMAPARMVAFMNQHIAECEECLAEPALKLEVEKIKEIVLPASKMVELVESEVVIDEEGSVAGDADEFEERVRDDGEEGNEFAEEFGDEFEETEADLEDDDEII